MRRKTRYYQNLYMEYKKEESFLNEEGNILERYWIDDRIEKYIQENASLVLNYIKNNSESDWSVYVGTTGICLALKRISKYLHSSDANQSKKIKDFCTNFTNNLSTKTMKRDSICPSYLIGPLGVTTTICAHHSNKKQGTEFFNALKEIKDCGLKISTNSKEQYWDEILYGRSGYLYILLKLYHEDSLTKEIPLEFIDKICGSIIESGHKGASSSPNSFKLYYVWHGKNYFGAAHGYCGIFYQLLDPICLTCSSVLNALDDINSSVDTLFTYITESGNILSSENGSDELVQWCHGAAGAVFLALRCHKVFRKEKYLQLAIHFGDVVWKKGILTKSIGLCHGVSGNGYAFIALYNYTKDERYLYYALRFAHWIVNNYSTYPDADNPLSLYEGLAGVVHYLVDLYHPSSAKFPGFQPVVDTP